MFSLVLYLILKRLSNDNKSVKIFTYYKIAEKLMDINEKCSLCPKNCNADRTKTAGACGEKNMMRIAKYYLHPYEEPFISGTNGSGTVFFTGCSLKCRFCQNFILSRSQTGKEITPLEFADIFKELENAGAHNINLVTPTHFLPQIYQAVKLRRPNVPIVYNTHGYEKEESLRLADKFVDVYLPDFKYFSEQTALRYSGAKDYPEICKAAITHMMREKKTQIENGLIVSGVCVRHLILPLNVQNSIDVVDWFIKNREGGAYFSLMAQYTPFGDIKDYPELNRKITAREYERVADHLLNSGIEECFIQKRTSASESFIPKWDF